MMPDGVLLEAIGEERGQRRQVAPDGVGGQPLMDDRLTPRHDVGARCIEDLFGPGRVGRGLNILSSLPVSLPRVWCREVGHPFEFGGNLGHGSKWGGGQTG